MWASVWSHTIRRTGGATSAKPSNSSLLAAYWRQGGILAVLPRTCVVILDCAVTHPAAALYVQCASQHAALAVKKAGTHKCRAFDLLGDGAGYGLLLLAGESFRRLGKEAACFLSDLGEVAAYDSCVSKSAFVRTV